LLALTALLGGGAQMLFWGAAGAPARGEDPARVREVLSGELLTSARRAHAELEASLRFRER